MTRKAVTIPQDIGDDAPIRLDIAARIAFPDGSIGLSAMRSEAKKGRLVVWRVAGKDMTTLSEVRKMVERCRVPQNPPVSGSVQPTRTEMPSGSSSTEEASTALAAAKMRAKKLKDASSNISRLDISPLPSARVIPLKSP